jgi:hypothetical protein
MFHRQGGLSMAGVKLFVNNTSVNLKVTIYIRNGQDPGGGNAGTQAFAVPAHGKVQQTYGNDTNTFLNGISFFADDGTQAVDGAELVITRSGQLDNLLNQNNTIEFNSLSSDGITGTNS